MKLTSGIALPLVFAGLTLAASIAGQAGREALRDKKLASPFLKSAPWTTGYDSARSQAKKTGKLIFAYFTRSYAP